MSAQQIDGPTITIFKGEDKTIKLTVIDENRAPIDLAGATLTFTMKENIDDTTALITKVSTDVNQIEILSPTTDGRADIKLVPADTSGRDEGTYVFDIWVVLASGKQGPVIRPGQFMLRLPVTIL
jgi:hypothetical protein